MYYLAPCDKTIEKIYGFYGFRTQDRWATKKPPEKPRPNQSNENNYAVR